MPPATTLGCVCDPQSTTDHTLNVCQKAWSITRHVVLGFAARSLGDPQVSLAYRRNARRQWAAACRLLSLLPLGYLQRSQAATAASSPAAGQQAGAKELGDLTRLHVRLYSHANARKTASTPSIDSPSSEDSGSHSLERASDEVGPRLCAYVTTATGRWCGLRRANACKCKLRVCNSVRGRTCPGQAARTCAGWTPVALLREMRGANRVLSSDGNLLLTGLEFS